MNEILFCRGCSEYTMEEKCPKCREKTFSPKPARYSPLDKWGKWRREAKKSSE